MTSSALKTFRVDIQVVEDLHVILEAADADAAHEAADETFSACNVDGFTLHRHTFQITEVSEVAS